MKKSLIGTLLSAAICLVPAIASAFEPFEVKDIRVEGIQRTEAGTVFGYLPVKVGEVMTDDKAAEAVKALFATGFFKDVRLEIEGGVLVVVVDERPAIAAVDFTGMKEFDKDTIRKSLRDVGLAESRIFDRAVVDRAEQELKRQYLARGYYATKISTTMTPLERNRVGVNFAIEEGQIAKIRQINIIGNSVFKEKELLGLLNLRTPDWLSWYTKNDQYSKQKLSADLEIIRSYYLDRGYLEFSVDSTQVSISPDRKDIYITVNVTEGEKYSVSAVSLAGNMILAESAIKALVKVKPGEVYSREKMTETTKAITDKLANEGYAFANVNAAPELDKEKRQVAFTVFVDPGRRVYVRNINVTGNTKTRDEVVRQEMRQMEGAWYDGDKITKSKQRVDRLAYFDNVTVETPAVPGTSDQVDLNVNVKEKPSGFFMLGAGFSSAENLSLSSSITQQNLFGSGKSVSAQVNTSKINTVYSFSYTDPYYTVDGVSAGFDIYHRNVDTTSLSIAKYKTKSLGGGFRLGFPVTDDDYLSFGLGIDSTILGVDTSSPVRYQNYVKDNGDTFSSTLLNATWTRTTLDSRIYPTDGGVYRLSGEMAAPPGSLRYVKLTTQLQRYWPLTKDFTLYTNTDFGVARALGGTDFPFFKNFYAGGMGSVRGYESSSLGGKKTIDVDESRMGGTRRIVANAELLFPMPGLGLDRSVRLGLFFDAGQVWGESEKIKLGDLKYSTGASVMWASPMGPLKFSFGFPLNSESGDKVQRVQFTMGNIF